MKRIFLQITFGLLFYSAFTQQPAFVKKWDKRYGGQGNDLLFAGFQQTKDGGYILSGFTKSGMDGDKTQPSWGSDDYWVVKVDSSGNKQWDKRFGGVGSDGLTAFQQTRDGGYILCGDSGSGISGDKTESSRGESDYWIVKTDSIGTKEWDKRFGGTLGEIAYAIQQTNDGGYVFGGLSSSGVGGDKTQPNWDSTHFNRDYWVVKTDSLGNKQWDKRFGGIGDDLLTSLQQSDDGGYVLAGISSSDSSGDKTQNNWGFGDFWVVKIDTLGNIEWDSRYGGIDGEYSPVIIKTNQGGYLVGGQSWSGFSGNVTNPGMQWVVRLNENGNKEWDKGYFGGIGGIISLVQTRDSGFLFASRICGMSGSDKSENNMGNCQTWIVKTDSLGNKQWDKTIFTLGSDAYGRALETKDGCYAVASSVKAGIGGYVTEPNRDGKDSLFDYWLMKFCWEIVNEVNKANGNSKVVVYPNPFSSDIAFTLQKENLKEATFTITNLQGQIIFRKEENNLASSYTKMLDLSYLPNGVYFIEVIANGERTVKKVVKE